MIAGLDVADDLLTQQCRPSATAPLADASHELNGASRHVLCCSLQSLQLVGKAVCLRIQQGNEAQPCTGGALLLHLSIAGELHHFPTSLLRSCSCLLCLWPQPAGGRATLDKARAAVLCISVSSLVGPAATHEQICAAPPLRNGNQNTKQGPAVATTLTISIALQALSLLLSDIRSSRSKPVWALLHCQVERPAHELITR